MSRMDRRSFLRTVGRAGLSAAAMSALSPALRAALAAAPAPSPAKADKTDLSGPPDMIVRNERPEHWETSLEALGRSWITRNDRFFVRSHLGVPMPNPAEWKLAVSGLVNQPLLFTLAQMKALPQEKAVITIECAGNGRGLMKLPNTSGTQWGRGAVGTAEWTGVRLARVLERAKVSPFARHVWFEALDQAPMPGAPPFLRSIPIEKAMDDVFLAHTMNGEPLPALHGGPLRAVVPGWYGMASTKWVSRVRLEVDPSDSYFMAKGYHYVHPGEDPATAAPVEAMRVKSLITRPLDGGEVVLPARTDNKKPRLRVQGFAWAGPSGVKLVEVSKDAGRTWDPAGFMGDTAKGAWRAWATEFEVTPPARFVLMARATDNAGDVQPLEARPNNSGYANNSIHKVIVRVRMA